MKGMSEQKGSGRWHEVSWPGAIMRIKKVRCFKRKTKGDREAMTGNKNREAPYKVNPHFETW